MIIKKIWWKRRNFRDYRYVGYFLLGFIPLFISKEESSL